MIVERILRRINPAKKESQDGARTKEEEEKDGSPPRSGSGRRIPCLVVSGEMSEQIISGVTKAGATGYLAKYEMKNIVPAIERAIQVRS